MKYIGCTLETFTCLPDSFQSLCFNEIKLKCGWLWFFIWRLAAYFLLSTRAHVTLFQSWPRWSSFLVIMMVIKNPARKHRIQITCVLLGLLYRLLLSLWSISMIIDIQRSAVGWLMVWFDFWAIVVVVVVVVAPFGWVRLHDCAWWI